MGSILAIALFAALNAVYDAERILDGERIYHGLESFVRITVIAVVAWFDVSLMFLLSAVFWIVFEVGLNLLRGKSLMYVGYTAWTDRMLRTYFPKNPELTLAIVKCICLWIGIFINWSELVNWTKL